MPLALRFCLFVLLASSFYTPAWAAMSDAPMDCKPLAASIHDPSRAPEVLDCLEKYAEQMLQPGSAADKVRLHYLENIRDRKKAIITSDNTYTRGIQFDRLSTVEMSQLYVIKFPEISEGKKDRIIEGQCFDFSQMDSSQLKSFGRRGGRADTNSFNEKLKVFTEKMQRQVDELAKFFGRFHGRTLGGISSILFHPRQVQFCDQKLFYYTAHHNSKRRLFYSPEGVLYFGINDLAQPSEIEVLSSKTVCCRLLKFGFHSLRQ